MVFKLSCTDHGFAMKEKDRFSFLRHFCATFEQILSEFCDQSKTELGIPPPGGDGGGNALPPLIN